MDKSRLVVALILMLMLPGMVSVTRGAGLVNKSNPQQEKTPPVAPSTSGLIPRAIHRYSILHGDPIAMKATIDRGEPLTIPILGQPVSLMMRRNDVVKDGTQVAIDLPDGRVIASTADVWTYDGSAEGVPGSSATLTIGPGYAGGRINVGGAHLVLEDLATYTRSAADVTTLLLYDVKDVYGGPQTSAHLGSPSKPTATLTEAATLATGAASGTYPYEYIRPVADREYWSNWGGGTTCTAWCTHIATVINDITPEYQNYIGTTFSVSVFEAQLGYVSSATTQDLTTSQSAQNILNLFQQYLWAYTYAWPYDNAILFSGKVFTGGIIGLGEQVGSLNTVQAYSVFMAWNEYSKYGTHMEEWVAAHEIGHIFGGVHDYAVASVDSNGCIHYTQMWGDGSNQGKPCYYFDFVFESGNIANMQSVVNQQLSQPVFITTQYRSPTLSVVSYSPTASWVNPTSIAGLSDGSYAYVPWNADGGCAGGDSIVLDVGGNVYHGGRIWFWYYGYGNSKIRFEVSSDLSTWTFVNDVVLPFYSTAQQLKIAAGSYSQGFRYIRITLIYTNCNTQEFDSVQVLAYYPLTVTSYSPTASWVNDLNMVQLDGGFGYVPWNADGGCAQGDSVILDMGNGAGSSYSELTKNGGSIYFWYYGYGNSGLKFEVSNDKSTWTYVNQVNLPFYQNGIYLYNSFAGTTAATFRYIRLTLVYTNCNTNEFDSFLVI